MRVGYTGWTWISNERDDWNPINERHKENFEQFLREVSDLGYETVENFNWIADYYADDIEGFKAVVKKYNLKFENLYFYFSDDPEKDYEEAKKYLKFMKEVDAHYMNMQGVMWKDTPFMQSPHVAGNSYSSSYRCFGRRFFRPDCNILENPFFYWYTGRSVCCTRPDPYHNQQYASDRTSGWFPLSWTRIYCRCNTRSCGDYDPVLYCRGFFAKIYSFWTICNRSRGECRGSSAFWFESKLNQNGDVYSGRCLCGLCWNYHDGKTFFWSAKFWSRFGSSGTGSSVHWRYF